MSRKHFKRHWLRRSLLALALLATVGGVAWGRFVFYAIAPLPDDATALAIRILDYHRISCPGAQRLERGNYDEGTIILQCMDADRTRYAVAAQAPCSQTWGCIWFDLLCWNVAKIA